MRKLGVEAEDGSITFPALAGLEVAGITDSDADSQVVAHIGLVRWFDREQDTMKKVGNGAG